MYNEVLLGVTLKNVSQVHPESLAEPSLADVLQPLRRAVENAGSSLSMPNIVHKVPFSQLLP